MLIDQINDYASAAQSIATVAAFGVGGFWAWRAFVRSRQSFPEVKVTHSFFHEVIDRRWRLVRVSLRIENKGNVLIRTGSVETRLLQLKPWPPEIKAALSSRTADSELLDSGKMLEADAPDYTWPYVAHRSVAPRRVEIEPNESEEFYFDFIIRRHWEKLLVYSYVENRRKRVRKLGWPLTSVLDLSRKGG